MIRPEYLKPTCLECGRVFDLLNADDADEWANGHDCEPDGNTCDCCGHVYAGELYEWKGANGQGFYCGLCLPIVRKANPLCDAAEVES